MAEEHRCQAPRLCVNNCGFFGSPATQNLCSKCYRDLQLKEQQSSNAKLVLNQTLTSTSSPSSSSSSSTASASVSISSPVTVDPPEISSNQPSAATTAEGKKEEEEKTTPVVLPNRCLTCRKRVGFTGFRCRCEMVFCGNHRYPEQHGCAFDFKAMGKEQIAKANPLVKAEKLEKI